MSLIFFRYNSFIFFRGDEEKEKCLVKFETSPENAEVGSPVSLRLLKFACLKWLSMMRLVRM